MRRGVVLTGFGMACITAACTVRSVARDAGRKTDPNLPAVVQGPKLILASDTAHPDTLRDHRSRMSALSNELGEPYSLIAAAINFGDPRLLATIYSPDAVFAFGDSTYAGVLNVSRALVDMGRRSGLTDFVRMSRSLTGHPDSIYVDSGEYVMHAKRPGGVMRTERGTYAATWRHLGPPSGWVLRRDVLKPLPAPKSR